MKGIVRKLDDLGRVSLPIEYRRQLGYEDKQGIDLYIVNNVVHLEKGNGRRIDYLGRYTLPIEVRRGLKLDNEDLVDMWVENNCIHIRKATLQCVICECDDESQLEKVKGVLVCRSCGIEIRDKFMED